MNFLNLIRSTDWSYKLARQGLMTYRRWRFGLDNVHHTFYMARGCRVSSDLAAHEYSFVNIGCILGPKVELGRYAMLARDRVQPGTRHEIHRLPIFVKAVGGPVIGFQRPPRIGYASIERSGQDRGPRGCGLQGRSEPERDGLDAHGDDEEVARGRPRHLSARGPLGSRAVLFSRSVGADRAHERAQVETRSPVYRDLFA